MELKILKETPNQIFKRKEIIFEVESNIAPSREEIRKNLAKKISKDENTIIIKEIRGNFGSKRFNIISRVYDSREELEDIEAKIERKNPTIKAPEPQKEENVEGQIKEEKVE